MICLCFDERNVTVFWNKIEFSIQLHTLSPLKEWQLRRPFMKQIKFTFDGYEK